MYVWERPLEGCDHAETLDIIEFKKGPRKTRINWDNLPEPSWFRVIGKRCKECGARRFLSRKSAYKQLGTNKIHGNTNKTTVYVQQER